MTPNSGHGLNGQKVSNLPNILTFIRLGCIPLVLIFLAFEGRVWSFLAASAFGLAFITDFLDGFFARRYGAVTDLGKFLDPLADKILVIATMIMLIPLGRIPVWMVILIVTREIAVTGLRAIAASEGIVIQAESLGKLKTILQSVSVLALCLYYPYFGFNFHKLGMIVLWGALAFTLWSGFDYFRHFSREVFGKRKFRG